MQKETLLDLADAVQTAGSSLSKAHLLCQEICGRYFKYADQPYAAVRDQQGFILWEYHRYALYAHIVHDYLLQVETSVIKLSAMLAEHLDPQRENTAQD